MLDICSGCARLREVRLERETHMTCMCFELEAGDGELRGSRKEVGRCRGLVQVVVGDARAPLEWVVGGGEIWDTCMCSKFARVGEGRRWIFEWQGRCSKLGVNTDGYLGLHCLVEVGVGVMMANLRRWTDVFAERIVLWKETLYSV